MPHPLTRLSAALGYPEIRPLTASPASMTRMKMFMKLLEPGDGSNRLMRPPKHSDGYGTPTEMWDDENERLALMIDTNVDHHDENSDASDNAMFALIQRDPRYLATELVLGRMLWLRMQIQLSKHDGRRPARKKALDRQRQRLERIEKKATWAAKKLADLAGAVRAATGRGQQHYHSEHELRASYRKYLLRVEDAAALTVLRPEVSDEPGKYGEVDVDAEIAEQVGLPVEVVQEIRTTPLAIHQHTCGLVARDFETSGSADYTRQLVNDAMKREHQDVEPRERRGRRVKA